MDNKWARLLAYVTGLVNQELLLQNAYLAAENRILKAHLQPGFRLTDGERTTLAEIGKRLGRKALQKVAGIAKPDTLLAWYHRLIAHKFDGSKQRRSVGRPRIHPEIENLVVRLARENSGFSSITTQGSHEFLGHARPNPYIAPSRESVTEGVWWVCPLRQRWSKGFLLPTKQPRAASAISRLVSRHVLQSGRRPTVMGNAARQSDS